MAEKTTLIGALVAAQAEVENASLNKVNPHFKSKYADLAEIRNTVQKAFAKHGLGVIQATTRDDKDRLVMRTTVIHEGGESLVVGDYPLPDNTKPQDLGSAETYARRRAYAALGFIAAEEDDDANAAQAGAPRPNGGATITQAQRDELQAMLAEKNGDQEKFCAYLRVPSLDKLAASRFEEAKSAIANKGAK